MTALAAYYHGSPEMILIFLGFAVVVLGAAGMLAGWLVGRYEPRVGKIAYALGLLPAFVLLALITYPYVMSRKDAMPYIITAVIVGVAGIVSGWLVTKYRGQVGPLVYLMAAIPPVIPMALAAMWMMIAA